MLMSFPFGLDGVTPKTCVAKDKMSSMGRVLFEWVSGV